MARIVRSTPAPAAPVLVAEAPVKPARARKAAEPTTPDLFEAAAAVAEAAALAVHVEAAAVVEPAPVVVEPADVADDFDPAVFVVNGRLTRGAALAVGDSGTCPPSAVFVPPAGHPRHDPRALVERSAEFRADVRVRGVQQPVAVFLLDGRVEVLDGRGRLAACAEAFRPVPFVVVEAPVSGLDARMGAYRLNALRLAADPLTRADLAAEALAAGQSVEDVAAALGEPVSTVRALVRVATEADETTRDLLVTGRVDASTALVLVQQTPEVRAAIVEAVVEAAVAAESSATGEHRDAEVSNKPVAKVDRATGKAKVSKTLVEAARDAAKGKAPKRGGGDAAAKAAPKAPAAPAAPRLAGGPVDTVAAIRARADACIAKALLAKVRSGTEHEATDRAYLNGARDALEALFDAQWVVGNSHPRMDLANAVLARKAVRS